MKTTYNFAFLLGGGLNPVLGSVFRYFPGFTRENFHKGGKRWNWPEAKVWSFVVDVRTNFLSVFIIVCLSAGT
jgi:hypothetical protein